jgi:hypothetical protein
MKMVWKPNVTVAAVIARDGKFLLVEEETALGLRETLEESAYHFTPAQLIGIYRWHARESDTTYLRFAFSGEITGHEAGRTLDTGILRAVWLSPDEIRETQARHRSPLVLRCVEDYLAGKRYSLDMLVNYE